MTTEEARALIEHTTLMKKVRLTKSEDRVARLAAEGMSNAAIAESLNITAKGVEWHLTNVYHKTGVRRGGLHLVLDIEAPFPVEAMLQIRRLEATIRSLEAQLAERNELTG